VTEVVAVVADIVAFAGQLLNRSNGKSYLALLFFARFSDSHARFGPLTHPLFPGAHIVHYRTSAGVCMASAQGQDRSDDQDIYPWTGLQFGFAKATNGLSLVDPSFASNWSNLAHAGLPRGAYHELTASASAEAQATFFVATVKAQGLRDLDMLVVVASDYPGVTGGDVEEFCAEVVRVAGPHNPMLIYSDLSFLPNLTGCTRYELWAAWPNATAPESVWPFANWRFWQYSITDPVDLDAYNGSPGDLRAWLATYAPSDPPPTPTTRPEDDMPVFTSGSGDLAVGQHVSCSVWNAGASGAALVLTGDSGTELAVTYLPNKEGVKPFTVNYPLTSGVETVATPRETLNVVGVLKIERVDTNADAQVTAQLNRW
jgi:lysozyme